MGINHYHNFEGYNAGHDNVKFGFTDETSKALTLLYESWGEELSVNSGYRSKSYNAKIYKSYGKKPTNSQHTHGTAVDIDMSDWSPKRREQFLNTAIDSGFSSFGFYKSSPNMLHIDTRSSGRTWGNQPSWARKTMSTRWHRGMKPFGNNYAKKYGGGYIEDNTDGIHMAGASGSIDTADYVYQNQNNSKKYTASYKTNNPFNIKNPHKRKPFWRGMETGFYDKIPGQHVIFDNPAVGAAGGVENLAYWGESGRSLTGILSKFTPTSDNNFGHVNRPTKIAREIGQAMRAKGYKFDENAANFNKHLNDRNFIVDFMNEWSPHESPVKWDPRVFEDAADIYLQSRDGNIDSKLVNRRSDAGFNNGQQASSGVRGEGATDSLKGRSLADMTLSDIFGPTGTDAIGSSFFGDIIKDSIRDELANSGNNVNSPLGHLGLEQPSQNNAENMLAQTHSLGYSRAGQDDRSFLQMIINSG